MKRHQWKDCHDHLHIAAIKACLESFFENRDVDEAMDYFDSMMKDVDEYMLEVPNEIIYRHAIYRFNMASMLVFAYLMGACPNDYFYTFYAVLSPIMLLFRLNNYIRTGKHFYFLDFCYVSSLAIWIFIVLLPKNEFLYKVSLNLAFGILAMSFAIFGDTFDLGHMDRHISTIVHLVPALVMYNVHCVTTQAQKDLPVDE